MNALSYADLRLYYASQCPICKGKQSVVDKGGIRRECSCQKQARQKWRLEQIQIRPEELKLKSWSDFNGTIKVLDVVIGHLTLDSALEAKNKAFDYCFKQAYDPELLKNRSKNLKIHEHLDDGQNLIIIGEEGSGKSFLGLLVLKELIYASGFLQRDLEYRWVESYDLIHAATWQTMGGYGKAVDDEFLDFLTDLDFLFLDGVDTQKRGHNRPPDHYALDKLFGSRRTENLPTVVTCSKNFWKLTALRRDSVQQIYGDQFLEILLDESNVVIELVKEKNE